MGGHSGANIRDLQKSVGYRVLIRWLFFVRILLLASHMPYPLDNGEDLRVFHFAKNLAQRHELYFLGHGAQADPNEATRFFQEIYLVDERDSSADSHSNHKSIVSSFSPRAMYSFYPAMELRLKRILREAQFDALWIPAWRMMPYSTSAGDTPVVLDVMDDGVLELAREIKNSRWSMDLVLKSKKLFVTYLFERKYLSQAAVCIFVADRDAEVFNRVCRRTRISVFRTASTLLITVPWDFRRNIPVSYLKGIWGFHRALTLPCTFAKRYFL